MLCEVRVAVVVLDSGVDQLLLAEGRELVGAEGVLVVREESVGACEVLYVEVEFCDR